MSSQYKETQLIRPRDAASIFDNGRNTTTIQQTAKAEELFEYENIYRDVKSEVIPGPIKTTKINRVTKVPKIIFKERKIAPDVKKKEKRIITKEVEVENIIEVPEVQEQIVYDEVKVHKYVDVPVVHPRQAVYYQQISKNIPKGAELVITQTYEVPQIKPRYIEIPVPIYVPCYIEVPIPALYIPMLKGDKAEYFTSGISDSSKLSRRPNLCNSSNEQTAQATSTRTMNVNVHLQEKSIDMSSKCSTHNLGSSDQKNLEKMVLAGNI